MSRAVLRSLLLVRLSRWALCLCLVSGVRAEGNSPVSKAAAAQLRVELDRAIAIAGPALLAARSAAEIDPLLARFAGLCVQARTLPAGLREEATQALDFVTRWQDYLHQTRTGPPGEGAGVLQQLLKREISSRFVARLELLSLSVQADPRPSLPFVGPRLSLDQRVALAAGGIRTFDESGGLLESIESMLAVEAGYPLRISDLLRPAKRIASLHQQLKDGAAPVALLRQFLAKVSFQGGPDGREVPDSHPELTARFREEFLQILLPQIIGLDLPLPRQSGETNQEYLARAVVAASQCADWPSVANWTELRRQIAGIPTPLSAERAFERPPYSFFLAGQNFERARLPALAVQQYTLALRDQVPELPVGLIEARLRALEREHPAEYARVRKGIDLAPPRPTPPLANSAESPPSVEGGR